MGKYVCIYSYLSCGVKKLFTEDFKMFQVIQQLQMLLTFKLVL